MSDNSGHGRPASWLAVFVILAGFTVGGIGLTIGPAWWLVWTGTGITVVGGIIAMAVRIVDDVVLDTPRVMPEERHHSARS